MSSKSSNSTAAAGGKAAMPDLASLPAVITMASPLYVLTAVLCGISTVCVLLRIYVRSWMVRYFGPDDALIVFAWLCTVSGAIVVWKSFDYGLGAHMFTVPRPDVMMFLKLVVVEFFLYLFAAHSIRASLVVFYRRLTPNKGFHMACWIYLIINGILLIVFACLTIFRCKPISGYWDKSVKPICLNGPAINQGNGIMLIILDIGALLLPIPTVLGLQIPQKQKLSLIALFGLGIFVCVASVFRLQTFVGGGDLTHGIAIVHAWTLIEIMTGLIAACIPSLKPLFTGFKPAVTGYMGNSSRQASEMDNLSSKPTSKLDKNEERVTSDSYVELLDAGSVGKGVAN